MAAQLDLYEFQEQDVADFEEQRAVLWAHEMGAGKTFEAIERDRRIRLRGESKDPTLVVAKLGALTNVWLKWFQRQTDLDCLVIDPKNRGEFVSWLKHAKLHGTTNGPDVYLIHWEALRILRKELMDVTWLHIVADECHRMKNRKAQQTVALKSLTAWWKTALSGTPADNHPQDFWSVLHWLHPTDKYFSSYWRFYKEHVNFEIIYPQGFHKIIGPKNVRQLQAKIQPYYRRHLKKAQCCEHHPQGVMPWLPEKYWSTRYVDLSPSERKPYDQMRRNMIAWVGAQDQERPIVAPVAISQLQRLQMFALGTAWLDEETNKVHIVERSTKLDEVMDILEELDGRQLVVFSQFKDPLYLLQTRCISEGISMGLYTGDNTKERDQINRDFLASGIQVLGATIAAGGESIDLTSADTVVFLDRAWNPAHNKQAEDRLWRGGQENAVHVIDIVARNTVDFGRIQKINLKWSWIQAILGDKVNNEGLVELTGDPDSLQGQAVGDALSIFFG